jgi:superfamily II DNA/RNA helicase
MPQTHRQARRVASSALAVILAGGDLVVNAATGAGKGLLIMLPAVADWARSVPGEVGMITLVVVPYKALGERALQSGCCAVQKEEYSGNAEECR